MAAAMDIRKLRNIGIIAHIDAGKTTTTERILYYAGESHKMGDVDEGNTITDDDPQEQEKGITIRAAAVSCSWKDVRINLIDTPGHVDFTAEVERSLRVLDGGVVVFSGVEGVEAQSETVWHQAERYRVPRICFINKLDRIGADFDRVYEEIIERLQAKVIPLQIPVGKEKAFHGVIDLIAQKAYFFDEQDLGKSLRVEEIPSELQDDAELWRARLIEELANVDDAIAEAYLEEQEISEEALHAAVRAATLHKGITPILCGSSLKYIGVQPLLDAIAQYLPSPLDVPPVEGEHPGKGTKDKRKPNDDEPFCGLLFKIQADKHDELGFVRIYSGTLKPSSRVLNVGKNIKENVTRIWHLQASNRTAVDLAHAGDIVGVVGMKNSVTGDTICDPKHPILLESITFPNTVISMSIEPESSSDKKKLETVLALMQKEDPTFLVRTSDETGEVLISGMGELHLDVKVERMRRDFNLNMRTSRPRVSYRETIQKPVKMRGECDRQMASGPIFAAVTIELAPLPRSGDPTERESFRFINQCASDKLPPALAWVVEEELKAECLAGGISGYPLTDIQATLLDVEYREGESNEQAYRFAVARAVRDGLEQAGVNILEPVMKVEVSTPEEYVGEISADLSARRAMIEEMSSRGLMRVIVARAPLRAMFGYSTTVRSLSQGRASYAMEPLDYEIAPKEVGEQMF